MVKLYSTFLAALLLPLCSGLWCRGALASAETSGFDFPDISPLQLSLNMDIASGSTTGLKNRNLQAITYQAKYMANFQVLKDPFCLSSSPVIHVVCKGSNIQILNVSHPTILCNTVVETRDDGTSYISCENTCVDDSACEAVYLAVDLNSAYGPFGAVEFQCSGTDIADVEGSMLVVGNANEQCGASSTQKDSRIFHIAQLAVACPSGSTTKYMYDDYFFECRGEATFAQSGHKAEEDREVGDDNRYTCGTGKNCDGAACTIDVKDLYIQSNVSLFRNTCVEPPVDTTAPPTQAPVPESESSVLYTIQFEASWGVLYGIGADLLCSSNPQSVLITCSHGDIRLVNASSTIDCTTTDPNAMECTDSSAANVLDRLTAVHYECSASTIPKTKVEYPETSASCSGNANPVTVANAVQLGVFCAYFLFETFYFSDVHLECSEARHQFDYVDQFGSYNEDIRFTCLEAATFQSLSTLSESQTIPSVAIETDLSWTDALDPVCYTISTQPPSPVKPTSVPMATPSLTTPTPVIPTESPINVAPTLPSSITAISAVPVAEPAGPTPQETSRSSDGDGESGFGVGVAVGGAAVAIVFAGLTVFLILRRNGTNGNESAAGRTKPVASADIASNYQNDQDPHTGHDSNAPELNHDPFMQANDAPLIEHEPARPAEIRSVVAVAVDAQSTHPPQVLHVTDTSLTESSHSPSRPTAASSPRAPMNPVHLDYKDQARSVALRPTPLLFEPNGAAIGGTVPQTRPNSVKAETIAMAIATPLDVSSISNQTGYSGGSNSVKSRGLEP